MFSHTNYYSQHTQRKVVLERDTKITPALYKHIKTCVQEQREKNSWYTHVQATNSCTNYCYTLKSDINTHTHTIIKYTITIYTGVAMIDTHYCYNSSCTWGASHNWAPREVPCDDCHGPVDKECYTCTIHNSLSLSRLPLIKYKH